MYSDRVLPYSRLKPMKPFTAEHNSSTMIRNDFPSSATSNFRKMGRMYASPSLDRLNTIGTRNGFSSRQNSLLSLTETASSLSMSIGHRNRPFQQTRDSSWKQSDSTHPLNRASVPRSRHGLNTFNGSYNDGYSSMITSHSPTPPRYIDSPSMSDRRDILMGHLNSHCESSPRMTRRSKPMQLANRSVTTNHWSLTSPSFTNSGNNFRARLRERPILSEIKSVIQSRPSVAFVKTGESRSSTKIDEKCSSNEKETGIYRNRYLIKFREHNLGQTASQRRSSITWDLPTTRTDVITPEQLPITEQSELNQELEGDASLTPNSNYETQQKDVISSDMLNKTENSRVIQKEIKNEEMKEELILDEKSESENVSNITECKATREVIDTVHIQTSSNMLQPDVLVLAQQSAPLKLKDPKPKVLNSKTKSPKKKKVKKKDNQKDQVKTVDAKQDIDVAKENVCSQRVDNVIPKSETVVCKDENENIINGNQLNKVQIIDQAPKRIKFRPYSLDDFNLLKVLGRGSFGKVFLAELKDYGIHFAIKCLKKHSVIEDDDVDSIMIERKVLAYGSTHPFICKLFCTFQTQSYLCFAMEWCCGGDLMFHVQKSGKFNEDKARFYGSEILCAVEYMHKKGIIYRDLKLDNIMIDKEGHLRLVDFGMCQGRIYREELLPSNFCGTPEYMAPEIIKGIQYNQSVDFWSLGVVIYEMVVGTSPFNGTDEDELLWNVCYEQVNYPRYLSDNVKNLIVLLLNKVPEQRLGMPKCPAGDIQSQPFFKSVEWEKVAKCQIKPPFIPELTSPFGVKYFDVYFTKEEPNLTPIDESIIGSMDQTVFKGFSYTNHNMTD